MILGQKIKKLREFKNLTQEYMAEQLGMNQGSYSKIESGETDIPFSRLEQIANVLELSVENVVGFDEKIVFNLMNNVNANGLVIHQASANEKRLYEELIETLKGELTYLRGVLGECMKNKSQ